MAAAPHTIHGAYDRALDGRWRNSPSSASQARQAITTLMICHHGPDMDPNAMARLTPLEDIGDRDIRQATAVWYSSGLSPATINKRLNCLSALGISVQGLRQREPKTLKWWFKPEVDNAVLGAWSVKGGATRLMLQDYIHWTCVTGLRVEETLRLRRADFSADYREVTVPGLKTSSAQATLALDALAVEVVNRRYRLGRDGDAGQLFPITYDQLHTFWDDLKAFAGWPPEATLKGLRRTAARFLHVDRNMPLDLVRQYLRHEDIETTMGYLRLTGGYSLAEQRRFLR